MHLYARMNACMCICMCERTLRWHAIVAAAQARSAPHGAGSRAISPRRPAPQQAALVLPQSSSSEALWESCRPRASMDQARPSATRVGTARASHIRSITSQEHQDDAGALRPARRSLVHAAEPGGGSSQGVDPERSRVAATPHAHADMPRLSVMQALRATSAHAKKVLLAGVAQALLGMILFNLGLNFGFTSLGDQVGISLVCVRVCVCVCVRGHVST